MKKEFLCALLLVTTQLFACSNPDEEANKLYIEATKLLDADEYAEALQKLESIIEKHPKSDMAVDLVQGKTLIGKYTMKGLKQAVLYQKGAIEINQLKLALDMYTVVNGEYPTTRQGLDALVSKPAFPPEPKGWNGPYVTATKLKDPWERPYQYRCPGTHKDNDYDLYSYGTDGQEGGGDDITSWIETY